MVTVSTLCYVIKGGKILLIRKKTGLAAGVWNGPGGKVENDEDIVDAAKREIFEEVDIVPEAPKHVGELEFFYGQEDEVDWLVHIFTADDYDGIEKESAEAVPKWFSVNRIPYNEMWLDDAVWMPLMLEGKKFKGRFYFNKEMNKILRHEIEVL
jgi:8-oxo-dGTP diphosphatase